MNNYRSPKVAAGFSLRLLRSLKVAATGLLLTAYCIALPSFALSQDIAMKFAFTIEKFYKESLDTPIGVFVDNERQEVYVVDTGRGEVLIFDLKGAPIFKFGKEQGISNPFDLVVRDGRIYLVQGDKPYIEVFNYRGESVARVAPPEGIAFSPGRMAIDEDGALYVINKNKANCIVFDKNDKFIGSIGAGLVSLAGVAVSKDRIYLINFPMDIDFDKGNMVYIANQGAKRVSVFKIQR